MLVEEALSFDLGFYRIIPVFDYLLNTRIP